MMTNVSRRDFLRTAGIVGVGLPFSKFLQDGDTPPVPVTHWDGSPAGRILLNYMTVYEEPTWRASHTGYYYYNNVVPISEAVVGEGLYHTNHTWLKVEEGYMYSSWVQPVTDFPHNPAQEIVDGSYWGMVTVPIVWARSGPGEEYYARHRAYYNQVGRVIALENDYYQIEEIYGSTYWLPANTVRLIPPDEIAPISTHIAPENKYIAISVRDQVLRAYEGDQLVFQRNVSTGMPSSQTPFGEFYVRDKRPGQRMVGGRAGGGYNLPGVPWISYITTNWIALHGTYWHNDYGRRHSNGCINLHPEDAKWLFRWTTPVANYWDYRTVSSDDQPGTRVVVDWE